MAIHDTSKGSIDRNNPALNMHDLQAINQRKAHGTISANFKTDATNEADTAGILQSYMTIIKSGTYVLTRPANTVDQTDMVTHGLNFIPILIYNFEYTTDQPGIWHFGTTVSNLNAISGAINEVTGASIDNTNVRFSTVAPSGGGTYGSQKVFTFKYYLCQQTANNPDSVAS